MQHTQAIEMSIDIDASRDEVWKACTAQEALRTWFNDTLTIEPRVGGSFSWEGTQGDEAYRVNGRIIDYDEPNRFTIEWRWHDADQPTLLTLELSAAESAAEQTTVTLRHHGFEQLPDDRRQEVLDALRHFWDGDELIPLKQYVEGVGPSY
jgi:uncharacterized protein YndB with AHSA1/START domain